VWSGLKPGSYIYQSGSHAALQVQMGLYGPMTYDSAVGAAYPGIGYDADVVIFLSEVDPALHQAVATGNYGPGLAVTSTIDYAPKYFMINGASYPDATLPVVDSNQRVLLRFFNAGYDYRTPLLQGVYMSIIAEAGSKLPYLKTMYDVFLAPGKTADALVESFPPGTYAVYDRSLGLTNNNATAGGMMTFLTICNVAIPPPGAVGNTLMLTKSGGDIHFTWTNIPDATSYQIYQSETPSGIFPGPPVAQAASGIIGVSIPVPAGNVEFFKISGSNCNGEGPQ